MLQFNPYFRPTAKELLKNKLFDKFRNENLEQAAPVKLTVDIDDKAAEGQENTQVLIKELQ